MRIWLTGMIAVALVGATVGPATAQDAPAFTPDPGWMKLPEGMATGEITAVAVDRNDHVWVLQRPKSVVEADRAKAAPPVLHFAPDGRYVGGFGGPGTGYDWPTTEHSITVDGKGRVWIGGSFRATAESDDMLLAFTETGKFIRQIGRRGGSTGQLDTANMKAPADATVDTAANEVYVADGYGNRRVIVYDSETGKYKRMWSAFGNPPPVNPPPAPRAMGAPFTPESGDGPPAFSGVHGVALSRDGKVYVSDRNNQRIQVFTKGGRYLMQGFFQRNTASPQTDSGLAFSPDRDQRYLYVADWGNSEVFALDRKTLRTLGKIGGKGTAPGEFLGPHLIAADSKGNLYVAEVQGRRLQRLVLGKR